MFIYFCLHIFNYFHLHLAIWHQQFKSDFITKNLSILIMIMGSTTDQYEVCSSARRTLCLDSVLNVTAS